MNAVAAALAEQAVHQEDVEGHERRTGRGQAGEVALGQAAHFLAAEEATDRGLAGGIAEGAAGVRVIVGADQRRPGEIVRHREGESVGDHVGAGGAGAPLMHIKRRAPRLAADRPLQRRP